MVLSLYVLSTCAGAYDFNSIINVYLSYYRGRSNISSKIIYVHTECVAYYVLYVVRSKYTT